MRSAAKIGGSLVLAFLPCASGRAADLPAGPAPGVAEGSNDIFVNGFDNGTYCFWTTTSGGDSICVVPVTYIQAEAIRGRVRVENVFITGLTSDRRHLWVSDHLPAWYYEGVYVYRGAGATPLTSEFEVGAIVDIEGDTAEFDDQPPGNTLTELVASEEPTFVGPAGAGPTPYIGASVEIIAALDNGEQFEGVLVRITDVAVSDSAPGDLLTLRDNFVDTVEMDDDSFDYSAASFPIDTCFASVTGLMTINALTNTRRILPRSASDLALGAACLHP